MVCLRISRPRMIVPSGIHAEHEKFYRNRRFVDSFWRVVLITCWGAGLVLFAATIICQSTLLGADPKLQETPSATSVKSPAQLTPEQKQERLKERDRWSDEARQLCADGKYDEAIAAAEKMQAIEREVLGSDDPDTIGSVRYLATLHLAKGDIASARKLCEEELATRTKLLGKDHWQVADARVALADVDIWAALMPEDRQALARCDALLSRAQHFSATGDAKSALPLLEEVFETRKRLLGLQQQLAGINSEFKLQRDQQRRTSDDIRKALPTDAVLVDLLGIFYFQPASEKGKQGTYPNDLIAFVVRPGQPVERVELGPVKPIQQAIDQWRQSFGAKSGNDDPGNELRRLVWEPLEKYIAGAKTVLISPNSTLAPLPWGALPGKEPGTYLIDDVAISLVPIPSLLPELMANDAGGANSAVKNPSLRLVGDVDFGADPGNRDTASTGLVASRGGEQFDWPALPGTRDEVANIRASFTKQFAEGVSTELTGQRATKSAVRSEACKYDYLHISTHGFFAPPELKSVESETSSAGDPAADAFAARQNISGYQPGLLSGLVLAGAIQKYEDGKEDGILTALEVADLDLSHVQLATLSACETGLGQTAGAEGLLGLQRAFQTAGAKTVVASLWKVPDKATQVLMSRFYDNLWNKRMSKIESLREAQRWLLREGSKQPDIGRGLEIFPDQENATQQSSLLSPRYWAAFELSGDWR